MLEHDTHTSEKRATSIANGASESDTRSAQLKTLTPPPISFSTKENDQDPGQKETEAQLSPPIVQDPTIGINPPVQLNAVDKTQAGNKEEEEETALMNFSGSNYDIPPVLPEPSFHFEAAANHSSSNPKTATSNQKALPEETLEQMNGAFHADFSDVVLHTNSSKATEMGALAFASGKEVHFAPNQYNPESHSGQKLIGHELTHILQQDKGEVKPTKQAKGLPINDDVELEQQADSMGEKAANFSGFKTQKSDSYSTKNSSSIEGKGLMQLKSKTIPPFNLQTSASRIAQKQVDGSKTKGASDSVLGHFLEPMLSARTPNLMGAFTKMKPLSHGMIASRLKTAKWKEIQQARVYLEGKTGKKLEQLLIDTMKVGDSNSVELVSSIYYVRNIFKANLHLDVGLCLLTAKPEAEILIRVLERAKIPLEKRRNIKIDYDRTFMLQSWGGRNLSGSGFTQDIMKRFSLDNEKKILGLLDHELTAADQLVYHITGDHNPKAAISIFTTALESGFKGIKKLEDDWRKYINTKLPGVHYVFHKKPLFAAVKSTFGEDSQVWKTVAPIEQRYREWAVSDTYNKVLDGIGLRDSGNTETKKDSKKYENELLLKTAIEVIEQASKGGQQEDDGVLNAIGNHLKKGTEFETKNYDEQILWAISTVKKLMPQIIEDSESKFEKGVNISKWLSLKIKINHIVDTSYSGKEKEKAALEFQRDTKSSTPWVDDFYIAIKSGNKEQSVSLAHSIWAGKKVDQLHTVLAQTQRAYTGFEIGGNAGERSRLLVSLLSSMGQPLEHRGYKRLKYEIMEKTPDLDYIKAFISETGAINPSLLEASIALFLKKETLVGISSIFQTGDRTSNRKQLLEVIKFKKYTKVVDEYNWPKGRLDSVSKTKKPTADFLKLQHVLVPAQTNDEKIEYAEEYAKKQGNNGNVKNTLADLELARMHGINDNAEGLDSYKQQMGIEDEAKLMDISAEELILRYDEARKELEEEAAFASFIVEMVAFGAIAILSGGSATGLLVAAIASKAAGMAVNEGVLGDKYELFSEENFKTLVVTGLTEVATLGVGSKFKALKNSAAFAKLGKTGKYVHVIAEQTTNQVINKGIEAAVTSKLPEWDAEVIDFITESIAASFNVKFGGIEDEKRFLKKAIVEIVVEEAPKEVSKALVLASVRGEEFDPKAFAKSMMETATKKLSTAIGKTWKSKDEHNGEESENKSSIEEPEKKNLEQSKGIRDLDSGHKKKSGETSNNNELNDQSKMLPDEDISGHLNTDRKSGNVKPDPVHDLFENTNLSWDEMVDSLPNEKDRIRLRQKRDLLKYDGIAQGGTFDPKASNLIGSDLDFQFESGKALVEADKYFFETFGPDYKHKYKVELFISKDRLLATDKIGNKEFREKTEFQHSELVRAYDLVRLKKYMDPNDPNSQRIRAEIDALPENLKRVYEKTKNLDPAQRREKTHELLLISDEIKAEIENLKKKNPVNRTKIDKKLAELSEIQIDINGLSDDGYTSKSVGSLEGQNLSASVALSTSVSNELAMIHKTIHELQGLGNAARDYRLYKYLFRPLEAMIKAGVELSDQQKHIFEISRNNYGTKDNAQRKFYEDFQANRSNENFEAVLQPLITKLHDFQQEMQDKSRNSSTSKQSLPPFKPKATDAKLNEKLETKDSTSELKAPSTTQGYDGDYRATWDGDGKAMVGFFVKGENQDIIEIRDVFRGNNPKGSGAKMIKLSMEKAKVTSFPKEIQVTSIKDEQTREVLKSTIRKLVEAELKGTIITMESGEHRGKPTLTVKIKYKEEDSAKQLKTKNEPFQLKVMNTMKIAESKSSPYVLDSNPVNKNSKEEVLLPFST